jgi:hypothetical protein
MRKELMGREKGLDFSGEAFIVDNFIQGTATLPVFNIGNGQGEVRWFNG